MPFVKGVSGNPSGKKFTDDPKAPPLLSAMRYVGRTKSENGDKGLQVHCRKLLNDDPAGFIKQLNALEQGYMKSKEPTAKSRSREESKETQPTEDQDEPLSDLLNSLIKEFSNGSRARKEVDTP